MKRVRYYKYYWVLGILFAHFQNLQAQILPTPFEIVEQEGIFKLPGQCRISVEGIGIYPARYLISKLKPSTGYSFQVVHEKISKGIVLTSEKADLQLGEEGYALEISPELVTVRALGEKGFFYAIQSLLQLFPKEALSASRVDSVNWGINCMTVKDKPKYRWRSFMLDSGRQYQKPEFIKRYLDLMAMLKMNVFHWHLTEGQGWRIEIKKYPLLTKIGSNVATGEEQQGYYTQEEIRDIVTYAKSRYIDIVPEIDVPGHSEAALTAYPEFTCLKKPPESVMTFSSHLFCGGNEETYRFLQDILDEVCGLFPFDYIHLGGDEAPKDDWDNCQVCQDKIKKEGLGNSQNLQIYFSRRLTDYLQKKDKKVIFWGDVIYSEGIELPENVVIEWWDWGRHKDLGYRNAIKRGHQVICATHDNCYLNHPVSPWSKYGKERTFDLKTAYEDNPSDLESPNPLVLGMGACLWTDWHVKEDMVDQRVFPRVYALAEQMWHVGDRIAYDDFYDLVKSHYPRLKAMGVDYGPANADEIDTNY